MNNEELLKLIPKDAVGAFSFDENGNVINLDTKKIIVFKDGTLNNGQN